jgi:hypothetical protein
MAARNWMPTTETLDDLIRQNVAAGDPAGVPDDRASSAVALAPSQRVATHPIVRDLMFVDADPVPAIAHDGQTVTIAADAAAFGSDFATVLDALHASALEGEAQ